jgi:hypothetical protein
VRACVRVCVVHVLLSCWGSIHELLNDEKRRVNYDRTGAVDEAQSVECAQWEEYWRALFPPVTVDAIEGRCCVVVMVWWCGVCVCVCLSVCLCV